MIMNIMLITWDKHCSLRISDGHKFLMSLPVIVCTLYSLEFKLKLLGENSDI